MFYFHCVDTRIIFISFFFRFQIHSKSLPWHIVHKSIANDLNAITWNNYDWIDKISLFWYTPIPLTPNQLPHSELKDASQFYFFAFLCRLQTIRFIHIWHWNYCKKKYLSQRKVALQIFDNSMEKVFLAQATTHPS